MKTIYTLLSSLALTLTLNAAPPANDNFANAQELVSGVTFNGTTVGATREPGDPGNDDTVWFKWTAPASGVANVSVVSSNSLDLSALVDEPPLTGKFITKDGAGSSFYVVGGHTYFICLKQNFKGTYSIQLAADNSLPTGTQFIKPLENDDSIKARQFGNAHEDFVFYTLGATPEPFEVDMLRSQRVFFSPGGGVWADWTAPLTGMATLTARNLVGTQVRLFVGTGTSTSTIMNVIVSTVDGVVFNCEQGIVYHLYFLNQGADGLFATIDATSGGGGSVVQPDNLIGNSAANLRGENVYNTDGMGQFKKAVLSRGSTHTFLIAVENDGDSTDIFTVAGSGDSPGWKVRYFWGPINITTEVKNGTYATRSLKPGDATFIKAKVRATGAATVGSVKVGLVASTSQTDGSKMDAVKFQATAR